MSASLHVGWTLNAWVVEAARLEGLAAEGLAQEPAIRTQDPTHGDYQSNYAFRLGKALKTNPRAVATALCARLASVGEFQEAVSSAEVAGPGFLNFRLRDDWLARRLRQQVSDPNGGLLQSGAGKCVVIDYSSPNVAKRMHVGHMRSTLIGHALHRLYAASGWKVVADNHIGDWGTQFGKLIVAYRSWLDEAALASDPIGELERLYVLFAERSDETLEDRARAETAKLQRGDPENTELWKRFIDISLREFERVYERLGVRFDVTLGESFYNAELAAVVQRCLDSGLAVESQGAVVIQFDAERFQDAEGVRDTVMVIRKKDGASLYGTTDLATLQHRRKTWAPARVVYVTDTRQQLHFRQVFAAWRKFEPEAAFEISHVWFGMLTFEDGVMASRGGNVVRLVDLLDEAGRRARAVVDQKNPDLPLEEREQIAEVIGVAAIRYHDLAQNPQSDLRFDWDRMLSLDGNTAPYLLYAVARSKSILRKADAPVDRSKLRLTHPSERALALKLLSLPESVNAALGAHRPNLLCDDLFDTANALNRFYADCPVLNAPDPETKASRLALVDATREVLSRGLQLLGISALERM